MRGILSFLTWWLQRLVIGLIPGCIVLFLSQPVQAQITVEEEISTDTVDLFTTPEASREGNRESSAGLAMGASLLVPGLGHRYLGHADRAMTFFTAEACFLAGALFFNRHAATLFESAKLHALTYAHVNGGAGADDFFWDNVGAKDTYHDFNTDINLIRSETADTDKYLSSHLRWMWESDSLREEYGSIRKKAISFQVGSTFFIAAMFLNRVVAFIDTRLLTRRSTGRQAHLTFYPIGSPGGEKAGIGLHGEF